MQVHVAQLEFVSNALEPIDPALARFDKRKVTLRPEHCRDDSRKAGTGSKIKPIQSSTWNMREQLSAVRYVASPYVAEAPGRDQILSFVLVTQQGDKMLETRHCRIIAFGKLSQPGAGFVIVLNHAASLRAWTSNVANAAGVTPGTLRTSTISRERPGIAA